jgi:N-acyl-L-homoserine lactone synthetase
MVATALSATKGFTERVTDLLDRLDYRLIETSDEREQVFRLRYDAYLREGAIAPNFSKKITDHFDDADNSWTFGVHIDGNIVSSMRVCVSSPAQPMTPAVDAFPDVLEPELKRGVTIIDCNRFVTDAQAARTFPGLAYLTVRPGFLACPFFEAEVVTASVRREHQAFYKRVFGFSPACEPRPYPTVTKPLSLMTVNYHAVRAMILGRPYYRSTFFERRMLFERAPRVPRPTAEMLRAKLPAANINETEIENADPLIEAGKQSSVGSSR